MPTRSAVSAARRRCVVAGGPGLGAVVPLAVVGPTGALPPR